MNTESIYISPLVKFEDNTIKLRDPHDQSYYFWVNEEYALQLLKDLAQSLQQWNDYKNRP